MNRLIIKERLDFIPSYLVVRNFFPNLLITVSYVANGSAQIPELHIPCKWLQDWIPRKQHSPAMYRPGFYTETSRTANLMLTRVPVFKIAN